MAGFNMVMADCACFTTKKKIKKRTWSWIFQNFLGLLKWFSQKVSIKQKFKENRTSLICYTSKDFRRKKKKPKPAYFFI